MNTAAKGRRNEHRSMLLFTELGYEVMRSAASKSAWDFIAYNENRVVFVQVKSSAWPGRAEMVRLVLAKSPPYSLKLVHRWDKGARSPLVREIT